jgi:hypothetical protein
MAVQADSTAKRNVTLSLMTPGGAVKRREDSAVKTAPERAAATGLSQGGSLRGHDGCARNSGLRNAVGAKITRTPSAMNS